VVQDFISRPLYEVCGRSIYFSKILAPRSEKLLQRFPEIGFDPRIDPQIYIGRDPKTSDDELKTSVGLEDHRLFPIDFRRLPTSHQFSFSKIGKGPENKLNSAVETAFDVQRTL